jgi:hypothetical protein
MVHYYTYSSRFFSVSIFIEVKRIKHAEGYIMHVLVLTRFVRILLKHYIFVAGLSGPPGAGKSTFIETFGKFLKSISWVYGSWIYNYLCNQCLSQLTLWVRIPLRRSVLDTTLCDKVCQWLATGRWFSPCTPVSSTKKTDCQKKLDIRNLQ